MRSKLNLGEKKGKIPFWPKSVRKWLWDRSGWIWVKNPKNISIFLYFRVARKRMEREGRKWGIFKRVSLPFLSFSHLIHASSWFQHQIFPPCLDSAIKVLSREADKARIAQSWEWESPTHLWRLKRKLRVWKPIWEIKELASAKKIPTRQKIDQKRQKSI